MRIRSIKPEFFTHEGLYDAEKETGLPLRVAFPGLWCAADRAGRFRWEPRRLGVAILPYDAVDFSRVLDALLTRGFIVKYRVKGADFGAIPSFENHQIINNREKESVLPDVSLNEGVDASATRQPRVQSVPQAEGKGREGKGREGKGDAPPPKESPTTKHSAHAEFIGHWSDEYPKHHDGQEYLMQGAKDGAAVKSLLQSKLTPLELIAVAVAAWKRPDGFWCKSASAISTFNSHFNQIRQELKNGKANPRNDNANAGADYTQRPAARPPKITDWAT